jgi:signal peptidase I
VSILARQDPRRGDIIVFRSPEDGDLLVKRVIALPGETVALRWNRLSIDGDPANYVHVDACASRSSESNSAAGFIYLLEEHMESRRVIRQDERALHEGQHAFGPQVVPADEYFVMGDNRDLSDDSRSFGFIPRKQIVGRVSSSSASSLASGIDCPPTSSVTSTHVHTRTSFEKLAWQ